MPPLPLPNGLNAPVDRTGRVLVDRDCSLPGNPEVFCIGDAAAFFAKNDAAPLPGVSPVAMQQGRFVARQIRQRINRRPSETFVYHDQGSMATIGRSRAVVEIGQVHLSGFIAWLVWLLVHIYYLIDFSNRVFVIISWAWSYLTYRRGARLITGRDRTGEGTSETRHRPSVPR